MNEGNLDGLLAEKEAMLKKVLAVCGGQTLTDAAIAGDYETCKLMLDNKVDVDTISSPVLLYTPLFHAVVRRRPRIVELLLEYGADLHYVSNTGKNALATAYRAGDEEIINIIKNHQWKKIVELLLEHGADPHYVSNIGKNAAEMAYRAGYEEIINIITNHQWKKIPAKQHRETE